MQGSQNFETLLHVQVYITFQHVVSTFHTRIVMKANDDTSINVSALLHMLHELTNNTDRFCYIGMQLTRDWCVWFCYLFDLCGCLLISSRAKIITF